MESDLPFTWICPECGGIMRDIYFDGKITRECLSCDFINPYEPVQLNLPFGEHINGGAL